MANSNSLEQHDNSARFAAVGAGRMGRGIAIAFAYAGYRISLIDLRTRSTEAWEALHKEVHAEIDGVLHDLVELEVIREDQVGRIANRIALAPEHRAAELLADTEMVVECVPETMAAKRDAFDYINKYCPETAILTSTTSGLRVTQLAEIIHHPERFLNTHWLNPAYVVPLVELSVHAGTDESVLGRTQSILESIGKLPVTCGPTTGYIVPRLQALIMNEAARMIEEGVATAEQIDKATRYGLGLRFAAIGVIEFIDFGGCDILYHASKSMENIDKARFSVPAIVEGMVKNNRLGLKSESGFYSYDDRNLQEYRKDVLNRTLSMLRHVDMLRRPADETIA